MRPFAVAPYRLRLRLFTNAGVREYVFAAPRPFKQYEETWAQWAERINNCIQLGSDLLHEKYLEALWLVDPPERKFGVPTQQWDVHVYGIEPGRIATLWNQNTGARLVQSFADRNGRIDVSIMLQEKDWAQSLAIGLDNEPFQPEPSVHRHAARKSEHDVTNVQVVIRQTLLMQVDQFDVSGPIDALQFADAGEGRTLLVRTAEGRLTAHAIPSPYVPGAGARVSAAAELSPQDAQKRGQHLWWWGNERRFTITSHESGRAEVLADYAVRSSHELSAHSDEIFAQASSDGHSVAIFRRGNSVDIGPLVYR
jgi:hypothetical protein